MDEHKKEVIEILGDLSYKDENLRLMDAMKALQEALKNTVKTKRENKVEKMFHSGNLWLRVFCSHAIPEKGELVIGIPRPKKSKSINYEGLTDSYSLDMDVDSELLRIIPEHSSEDLRSKANEMLQAAQIHSLENKFTLFWRDKNGTKSSGAPAEFAIDFYEKMMEVE